MQAVHGATPPAPQKPALQTQEERPVEFRGLVELTHAVHVSPPAVPPLFQYPALQTQSNAAVDPAGLAPFGPHVEHVSTAPPSAITPARIEGWCHHVWTTNLTYRALTVDAKMNGTRVLRSMLPDVPGTEDQLLPSMETITSKEETHSSLFARPCDTTPPMDVVMPRSISSHCPALPVSALHA